MNERSALANRIECSLYLGTLTGRDRDIILDALRAPALPSEETIARIICGTCDVTRTNDGTFEQKYVCDVVIDCDCCMAKARTLLALFAKSKGCT